MFKNLKISRKITFVFSTIIILAFCALGYGFLLLNNAQAKIENVNTTVVPAINVANDAKENILTLEKNIFVILLTEDKSLQKELVEQNKEKEQSVLSDFQKLKKYSPENNTELDQDIKALQKSAPIREQIEILSTDETWEQGEQLMEETYIPIVDGLNTSMNEVSSHINKESAAVINESQRNTGMGALIIMMIGLFIIIYGILVGFLLVKRIKGPLVKVTRAAQKMAEGSLNVQIDVESKDEVGQLCAAFSQSAGSIRKYIADITEHLAEVERGNLDAASKIEYIGDYKALNIAYQGILTSLNEMIGRINQSAQQVMSGSTELSNGAQILAQNATEQASSMQELAATITDVSTQVKQNAFNASNANKSVSHVNQEVQNCNQHMTQMVRAMSEINSTSSEIKKIIKTIEDIAFQTNLLSLNASVEAARAGSAGKGFAVVADEVRNLASKSADAAKNTTGLIRNAMLQIENGSKIADETAKSLLQVVESTSSVSASVKQISEASNKQSDSISQITLGVDQVSDIIQKNAATAEEDAASSKELTQQALLLKEAVRKFQLKTVGD
ncbi:MAG: methyl-accepting chemotaxis protein [Oscillospiraceae bacterium]|jgi:methyl-accepting chemotaxis protein|nr:methyl-accepting chemotaxis protein [Oscillospiraceae bacterium]